MNGRIEHHRASIRVAHHQGRRAAAVQVHGLLGAQLHHQRGQLEQRHARVAPAAAVHRHQQQLAGPGLIVTP